MTAGPLFPDPQALREAWAAAAPPGGLIVEIVAETGSTNADLLARVGGPCVVRVAEHQSAGRGRLGRTWASRRGDSLTFSVGAVLRRADLSGLSLAVGVALAEALEPPPEGEPRLMLKWPNDLWLRDAGAPGGGRKLGGVLIEAVSAPAGRWVVVGVGLNVRALPAEGMGSGVAWLQELRPSEDIAPALARTVPALLSALCAFEAEGLAPFAGAFVRRDLLAGRAVCAALAGADGATAHGIDSQGRLRLRAPDGRQLTVSSGEVHALATTAERPC
jgi:BirA family biotin operon repressor/biotin-[acetyl-CoA-carboxylase] ligase